MPDYEFTQYRRKQIAELRPYIEGEDVSHVSISPEDVKAGSPKRGDMIARNPKNHADQWLVARAYFLDNFESLTAAEQAEPAPMYGDEQEVYTDPDGKVWHPHRGYWCWKVSSELAQAQKRIKELEVDHLAPAARSGAVKVKAVLELVQYHVTDDDDRATLTMAISALEPAEPAAEAEPVRQWPDFVYDSEAEPNTRPPESRLREALEHIARGLSLTFTSSPTKMSGNEAQEIARDALAQEDGR